MKLYIILIGVLVLGLIAGGIYMNKQGITIQDLLSTNLIGIVSAQAAIGYTFTQVNSPVAIASDTYIDVTGASIASGSFTEGKKYLLYITAQVQGAGNGWEMQVVHGTTAFAESVTQQENVPDGMWKTYSFLTVWTAVSGESIKLQASGWSGATSFNVDQVAMLAMKLSDDLTENTDWFFNEVATDSTLSTTPLNGGSVTFTPGTANDDWLVLSYAQIEENSGVTSAISQISRSGEATSTTPSEIWEPPFSDKVGFAALSRVFTLGASSNTFAEKSYTSSGTGFIRLHSIIFALNLNKFKNHAFAYTEADASLSATNYATQLQNISITPDVVGDVWMGAFWGFDVGAVAREAEFRVQLDGADQPAGQTTDNYQFQYANDATNEVGMQFSTLASLSAAAHTINLNGSADSTTSTPAGQHRTLWAVTMELASLSDTQSPQWSSNSTNSTTAGTLINHTVLWTDNIALSNFTFSFDNGTGTFVNDSSVSMTGTSNQSSVLKFVNQSVGSTIRWRVYAWDLTGNNNGTSIFSYLTTSAVCWTNDTINKLLIIPNGCVYQGSLGV